MSSPTWLWIKESPEPGGQGVLTPPDCGHLPPDPSTRSGEETSHVGLLLKTRQRWSVRASVYFQAQPAPPPSCGGSDHRSHHRAPPGPAGRSWQGPQLAGGPGRQSSFRSSSRAFWQERRGRGGEGRGAGPGPPAQGGRELPPGRDMESGSRGRLALRPPEVPSPLWASMFSAVK